MEKSKRLEIAEEVAKVVNGKVWTPNENSPVIRVYLQYNGYIKIDEDGDLDIDGVKSGSFMEIKAALVDAGYNVYRQVK